MNIGRWMGILALVLSGQVLAAGRFNGVEVGQSGTTGQGWIYTKLAASAFSLDIVALRANGSADPSYRGIVSITLLNASDDSGALDSATACSSSWTSLQSLGALTIVPGSGGRGTLAGIVVTDAVRIARLMISDPVAGLTGCSLDAFSIRPASFAVAVNDQDAITAGTARNLVAATFNATTTPIHHAGRPFTVRVTARNSLGLVTPGYSGSPALSVSASLLGVAIGSVTAGTWSSAGGIARSDTASYSEAGAFTLQALDTTFTAVDNGDNNVGAGHQIGPASVNVGRFTPDNFTVAYNSPGLRANCGAFSYIGKALSYVTSPVATVTAINAAGGTTLNYTGPLFKLDAASVTGKQYLESALTVDPGVAPALAVGDSGNGVGTLTFDTGNAIGLVRGSPVAPYAAEISLQASLTDSDGVTFSGNPLKFGNTTPGNGIAILDALGASAKEVRFGQLRVQNAYGSERLSLPVPLRAEHYLGPGAGTQDFAPAANDTCTSGGVGTGNVSLSGAEISTSVSALSLSNGSGAITLTAPSPSATGRVTVTLSITAAYPWLRVDSDSDGIFLEDPSAVGSFGLYKGPSQRVYIRETVY